MLLKRTENEPLVECIFDSSNILKSEYNRVKSELTITFNYGAQYKYNGVSYKDYIRFEIDESQGIAFNNHIKKYKFEKLDKIDVSEIRGEIELIKNQDSSTLSS